jgi:hypothetical protein
MAVNGPRVRLLTSTNFFASACASRFRQAKKCGAHSPRSRQNAATFSPLLACWEISFRHLLQACCLRWVMPPACSLSRHKGKMGLVYRSLRFHFSFMKSQITRPDWLSKTLPFEVIKHSPVAKNSVSAGSSRVAIGSAEPFSLNLSSLLGPPFS